MNVRRTIGTSCFLYPCSLECTLSWLSADTAMLYSEWTLNAFLHQLLVPRILTACYQVVLLPLRDFAFFFASGAFAGSSPSVTQ